MADIEVTITSGLPCFEIVGLGDPSIRESKERVRSAILHSGYEFPVGRITVSLIPAYIHKSGSSFDLPLALCILLASGQIRSKRQETVFAFGELTLSGQIREIPGSISRLLCCQEQPENFIIIPRPNLHEAELLQVKAVGVSTLQEAIFVFEEGGDQSLKVEKLGQSYLDTMSRDNCHLEPDKVDNEGDIMLDFSLLRGQEKAGRAILLAAAGFHNVLLSGSPGSGKTTAAKILQGLLPPLELAEKLQLLKLQSATCILTNEDLDNRQRPFRFVHHTCTPAAMAGGGANPIPGEISLSLHGVLFLDEIAEFSPKVLNLLRQPMEEGNILISRAGVKINFPANFLLVGTMNPCKCGKLLENSGCTCNADQRRLYQNRISGPLMDRIDLFSEMYRINKEAMLESVKGINHHLSRQLRDNIAACWQRQYARCAEFGQPAMLNGMNQTQQVVDFFRITSKAINFSVASAEKIRLSARGLNRLLRVARTIADLEEDKDVTISHVLESLQFRSHMNE